MYIGAGSVKNAGIAMLAATATAPAPGAPGAGGVPPVLYTVASGSAGFGGVINITFCLLSTLRNALCCVKKAVWTNGCPAAIFSA